jgi:predicted O-methyltransferase YrrM
VFRELTGAVTRLGRYAQAWAGLDRLNRATMSLTAQPREMIHLIFRYSGAFLQPIQVEDEIVKLVEDVGALKPRTVLEIGTSMGGTLYLWTRLAQPDALIISVDLPGGKFGGGYSPLRTPLYRRFVRDRQTLHLMRANSHEASTLAETQRLLDGRQVDFLFIDGDHTYEGVKRDWEMYSPLVRRGGLVAFHDVAGNYEDTQVKRHWDAIKSSYQHREYLFHPKGFYGIGVLTAGKPLSGDV